MPRIVSSAVAFPDNYYDQEMLASALKKYFLMERLGFSDLDLIDTLFTNSRINGRYMGLSLDAFFSPPGSGTAMQRAIDEAVSLCESLLKNLLAESQLPPGDVAHITSSTCLYALPTLEARLMNRIPFSPDTKRMPLNGLGCMAGAAGLSRTMDYLQGHPKEAAISFAVEISSLLWQGSLQRDLAAQIEELEQEPAMYKEIVSNLISAALFADGAGAVLMTGDDHELGSPLRVLDTRSMISSDTTDIMGLRWMNSGLRNILRPEVPRHAREGVRRLIGPMLEHNNVSLDSVGFWLVHPGGPRVLEAIQEEFNLTEDDFHLSHEILAEYGNMSSATVLVILDRFLRSEKKPPSGSYGVMVAMGPGFSQEAVLMQWD